jgi:hypothetical protein
MQLCKFSSISSAHDHADRHCRRAYEGTDIDTNAMQAYLDCEYGLVDQLRRDATHGFFVM